MSNLPI